MDDIYKYILVYHPQLVPLLKNLLFIKSQQSTFEDLKQKWQSIIDLIYNNKEKPLRFLRYFIFANYREDRLREDEIYDWFVKREHRVGYDKDPLGFVDRLYDSAYAYTQFLRGQNIGSTKYNSVA